MKRLIIASLLILICITISKATDYTQEASCLGAWLCDEGSGGTLDDETSNNNDGTFHTSSPTWTSGSTPAVYVTNYLDFERDNSEKVNMGDCCDITGDATFVWWMNPEGTVYGNSTTFDIVDKYGYNQGGYTFGYKRRDTNNSKKISFILWDASNSVYITSGNTDCEPGTWVHCAVTYNGTDGSIDFFRDGVYDGSETISTDTYKLAGNSSNFEMGGDGYYFDGLACELAVFNTILSTATILDIKTNGLVGGGVPAATVTETFIPQVIMFGN